ncbi:hypothetical protein QR685DRAFT_42795 [Neurospora intermedia]|uniref:Secreted protein n=1 Tax=Neurospora intermedia TaxID=5142 RepID=A0ABR3DRI1_NEUIN
MWVWPGLLHLHLTLRTLTSTHNQVVFADRRRRDQLRPYWPEPGAWHRRASTPTARRYDDGDNFVLSWRARLVVAEIE